MQTDKTFHEKPTDWECERTALGDTLDHSSCLPGRTRHSDLVLDLNDRSFSSVCDDDCPLGLQKKSRNSPYGRCWRLLRIVLRCVFGLKFQRSRPVETEEALGDSLVEFRSLQNEVSTLKALLNANTSTADNSELNTIADVYIDQEDDLDKAMKTGIKIFELAQIGDGRSLSFLRRILENDPS